jgi:haloalkane dehalogenase
VNGGGRGLARAAAALAALVAAASVGASVAGASEPARRPSGCPPAQLPVGTPLGKAELRWTESCLPYVRTPSSRLTGLAGFPYTAHYADVDGLRMAYVDEGPRRGPVVLLLHGEPSWSYLYRTMIPVLADAGHRVIAPDLIGMGRSDKPVELDAYSYLQHVRWVEELIEDLDLRDVTLFVQDWGSLIGLRVVGDRPEWFARVVVANGRLPVLPEGLKPVTFPDPPLPNATITLPFGSASTTIEVPPHLPFIDDEFARWAVFALTGTRFKPSEVIEALTATELSAREQDAYDAPYPARIYMSGPRVFPSLINTLSEPPNNAAARRVFDSWTKPLLTLFGRLDEKLGAESVQAELRDTVPGAQGQPHFAYPDAHHFIQEDKGPDLARRVVAFIRGSS